MFNVLFFINEDKKTFTLNKKNQGNIHNCEQNRLSLKGKAKHCSCFKCNTLQTYRTYKCKRLLEPMSRYFDN